MCLPLIQLTDLMVGWLLRTYVQSTSKDISEWVPTCNSACSWWLYNAALLGDQATSTLTGSPTQSHYPDTESTSSCSILIIQSIWLGRDKYQFVKSLVWLDPGSNPRSSAREACTLPIRPPRPVSCMKWVFFLNVDTSLFVCCGLPSYQQVRS